MSLDKFRSKRIRVFRNADVFTAAKRLVVSHRTYRNFEQLLHGISDAVQLTGGAVRRLYTLEGAIVTRLEELEDNGVYVASGGESLKRIPYPLLLNSDAEPPKRTQPSRIPVPKSTVITESSEKLSNFFGRSSRGLRIIAFPNGEFKDPGYRLLLNFRNCKSFEQLLKLLSETLHLKSGHVRKIFDAETGNRIKSLEELYNNIHLVATTFENLKKGTYPIQHVIYDAQARRTSNAGPPKTVTAYPNGDSYHHGWTITVKPSRFPNLRKLIDHLNSQIELVTGRISNIYTMEGLHIDTIDELVGGASYVLASGSDPFIHTAYNLNSTEVEPTGPLAGSTHYNDFMSMIRKPRDPYSRGKSRSNLMSRKTPAREDALRKNSAQERNSKPKTAPTQKKETSKRPMTIATTSQSQSKENIKSRQASAQKVQSQSKENIKSRQASAQKVQKQKSVVSVVEEDPHLRRQHSMKDNNDIYESKNVQQFTKEEVKQVVKTRITEKPAATGTVDEDDIRAAVKTRVSKGSIGSDPKLTESEQRAELKKEVKNMSNRASLERIASPKKRVNIANQEQGNNSPYMAKSVPTSKPMSPAAPSIKSQPVSKPVTPAPISQSKSEKSVASKSEKNLEKSEKNLAKSEKSIASKSEKSVASSKSEKNVSLDTQQSAPASKPMSPAQSSSRNSTKQREEPIAEPDAKSRVASRGPSRPQSAGQAVSIGPSRPTSGFKEEKMTSRAPSQKQLMASRPASQKQTSRPDSQQSSAIAP